MEKSIHAFFTPADWTILPLCPFHPSVESRTEHNNRDGAHKSSVFSGYTLQRGNSKEMDGWRPYGVNSMAAAEGYLEVICGSFYC